MEPARLVKKSLSFDETTGIVRAARTRIRPRRVFVVAVGKAAIPMAAAAHKILGHAWTRGIVIAPSVPPPLARTQCFAAAHPIPDRRGFRAARSVIGLLDEATSNDVILLLLSGGASALMPAPLPGITLRSKQRVTALLLRRGASIDELNAVRKRLSLLKGGGFARRAAPARVVALAISDVPGDDIASIGSGPAVYDAHARDQALRAAKKFLRRHDVDPRIFEALERSERGERVLSARTYVIGSGRTFLAAAARRARALGYSTISQPDGLSGEARTIGPRLVRSFHRARKATKTVLLLSGETVVRVTGSGRGGRNHELALAAVPALARAPCPTALGAFATDGVDGTSGRAGALVDSQSAVRARAAGVRIKEVLKKSDSANAIAQMGDSLVFGPTGTNVSDIAIILG